MPWVTAMEAASPRSLDQELGRSKTSELLKRARSDGVSQETLVQIDDSDDPKAAAIDAVVSVKIRRRLAPELHSLLDRHDTGHLAKCPVSLARRPGILM